MNIDIGKLAGDVDTSIARIDRLIATIEADKKLRAADAAAADQRLLMLIGRREVKSDTESDKAD